MAALIASNASVSVGIADQYSAPDLSEWRAGYPNR
jgi:hypothetical protein